MANPNRKHKRVVLSIESKLSVLDSVASYAEVSGKFGIGKLMITILKKNEPKIREFACKHIYVWVSKSHAPCKVGD